MSKFAKRREKETYIATRKDNVHTPKKGAFKLCHVYVLAFFYVERILVELEELLSQG